MLYFEATSWCIVHNWQLKKIENVSKDQNDQRQKGRKMKRGKTYQCQFVKFGAF